MSVVRAGVSHLTSPEDHDSYLDTSLALLGISLLVQLKAAFSQLPWGWWLTAATQSAHDLSVISSDVLPSYGSIFSVLVPNASVNNLHLE